MNQLLGEIIKIETKDQFSKVCLSVDNHTFQAIVININAINPNLKIGHSLKILFKETDVSLCVELPKNISIDNQIPVKIHSIKHGVLLSRVLVAFQNTRIKTVVPAEFSKKLKVGKDLFMLIRSNELMLME